MSEAAPPAVDATGDDPRPVVRLPGAGAPGAAIAGVAAVLAALLFAGIERSRGAQVPQVPATPAEAFAPVPPLVVPPEPPPVAAAVPTAPAPPFTPAITSAPPPVRTAPPVYPVFPTTPPPPQPMTQAVTERPVRVNEAALVIDGGLELPPAARTEGAPAIVAPPAGTAGAGTAGTVGAAAAVAGDEAPARATLLGSPATTMPTGTIIAAVLETPIDTARPGLARAIVNADVRGFDGTRVLVARGSRLIGEFQADVRPGQNRVLVTWSRLIRPDGVTIRLASPGADALGGAGVPGKVHSFFFERFAGAVLQSALAVGVNLASRVGSGSVIVEGPGQGLNGVVGQQLLPGNDLKPKITIRAGAAVDVFVARDLDFSGVPALARRTGP